MIFETHFNKLNNLFDELGIKPGNVNQSHKLLIGSYFTSEYSIESAAFFNPSIVEDPDQSGLQEGEKRFIMSFRATGEGHISSIVFSGVVLYSNNNMELISTGRLVDEAEEVRNYIYKKDVFTTKLSEMHAN